MVHRLRPEVCLFFPVWLLSFLLSIFREHWTPCKPTGRVLSCFGFDMRLLWVVSQMAYADMVKTASTKATRTGLSSPERIWFSSLQFYHCLPTIVNPFYTTNVITFCIGHTVPVFETPCFQTRRWAPQRLVRLCRNIALCTGYTPNAFRVWEIKRKRRRRWPQTGVAGMESWAEASDTLKKTMWIAYLPCHERFSRPPVSDVGETGAFQIPGPPSKQWIKFIIAVLSTSDASVAGWAARPCRPQKIRQRERASCIMLFTCSVDATAKQTWEQRQQEQAEALREKILFCPLVC